MVTGTPPVAYKATHAWPAMLATTSTVEMSTSMDVQIPTTKTSLVLGNAIGIQVGFSLHVTTDS